MESAVIAHNDDTLIGSGGNNEQTAVAVNSHCDRLVDSALVEQIVDRLGNYLMEGAVRIKHYDTAVVGVAHVNVVLVYEHTGGIGEGVRNTVAVHKVLDLEAELEISVQTDDAGILCVHNIHALIGTDEQIAGIVQSHVQAHILGIHHHVRHVSLGGIQSEAAGGVCIGYIRSCGTDHGRQQHHQCNNGKQNT